MSDKATKTKFVLRSPPTQIFYLGNLQKKNKKRTISHFHNKFGWKVASADSEWARTNNFQGFLSKKWNVKKKRKKADWPTLPGRSDRPQNIFFFSSPNRCNLVKNWCVLTNIRACENTTHLWGYYMYKDSLFHHNFTSAPLTSLLRAKANEQ